MDDGSEYTLEHCDCGFRRERETDTDGGLLSLTNWHAPGDASAVR
jgi:hypothetical protein